MPDTLISLPQQGRTPTYVLGFHMVVDGLEGLRCTDEFRAVPAHPGCRVCSGQVVAERAPGFCAWVCWDHDKRDGAVLVVVIGIELPVGRRFFLAAIMVSLNSVGDLEKSVNRETSGESHARIHAR
jgi:hypothetical protein